MKCPNCNEPIWDFAFASKLNKCWNCMFAFDTTEEMEESENESL
jgi:hypothetical protein